jgi:quercetin dioxygenase-like cupin family protein
MQKENLASLAREHAEKAASVSSGRSSHTVYGGQHNDLRQTVIALTAGSSLSEHENPGEATLFVVDGKVRLTAAEESIDGEQGDLIVVPQAPHSLEAPSDAVVLLTVAKHH